MLIRTQIYCSTFCLVSKVQDSSLSSDKPLLNEAFCVMEPEVWKDVSEFPNDYQVSNFGRIRSKDRLPQRIGRGRFFRAGRLMNPNMAAEYPFIAFCKEGKRYCRRISALVALAFVANPDNKPIVGHIDNNPKNNHYKNLIWCSQSENIRYAFECGRKAVKGRPVIQMTLSGQFVKRFEKMADAEKSGFLSTAICATIKGRQPTAYGFLWKYAETT